MLQLLRFLIIIKIRRRREISIAPTTRKTQAYYNVHKQNSKAKKCISLQGNNKIV